MPYMHALLGSMRYSDKVWPLTITRIIRVCLLALTLLVNAKGVLISTVIWTCRLGHTH